MIEEFQQTETDPYIKEFWMDEDDKKMKLSESFMFYCKPWKDRSRGFYRILVDHRAKYSAKVDKIFVWDSISKCYTDRHSMTRYTIKQIKVMCPWTFKNL
jgi:hypothetical protein